MQQFYTGPLCSAHLPILTYTNIADEQIIDRAFNEKPTWDLIYRPA